MTSLRRRVSRPPQEQRASPLKRFGWWVALPALAAAVVVHSAGAGNFDEERMGCIGEDPATCPAGTVGEPYSLTIYLTPPDGGRGEDFGCATFHRESGSFPPGLSISDEGYVSGTPTAAGTYEFYLLVKYDKDPACSKVPSDDRFVISINPAVPKLMLGPESTTPGTVGTPYSLQMTATVPDAKTWSIAAGTLPPGLSIDSTTGLISGVPSIAGTYSFAAFAKVNADSRADTKWLTIDVRDVVRVVGSFPFTSAGRAPAEVGVPFTALLTGSGGTGAFTWSVATGALPPGLTLVDGAISGTPTSPGSYAFTATVTDSEGRVAGYPGWMIVEDRLAIATQHLRPAKVGKLYRARISTRGGVGRVKWRLLRGKLPPGVRFAKKRGLLVGTPRSVGARTSKRLIRYRLTLEAADLLGITSTRTFVLVVTTKPKPRRSRRP